MDTSDFKHASHAISDAMAPGWDERHAYFEEIARGDRSATGPYAAGGGIELPVSALVVSAS